MASSVSANGAIPVRNDESQKHIHSLRATAVLLERTDDLLMDMAREAIQYFTATINASQAGPPLPATEYDMRQLKAMRAGYLKDRIFDTAEIEPYFAALPGSEDTWMKLNRIILRYFYASSTASSGSASGRSEWIFWLTQVERAGTPMWEHALTASVIMDPYSIRGLISRLEMMDKLLDELHGSLDDREEKRPRFSSELRYSIMAKAEMRKRGLPLEIKNMERFKAIAQQNDEAAQRRRAGLPTAVNDPSSAPTFHASSSQAGSAVAGPPAGQPKPGPDPTNKYNPTTFAAMIILTIAAACLTGQGCITSPHERGTTNDADFWFLVQASLMQLAGMAPVVPSLLLDSAMSMQPRLWSWVFLASGTVLALLAPLLYCFIPTEYTAVLAFAGSIMQTLLVLEAMVQTGKTKTD